MYCFVLLRSAGLLWVQTRVVDCSESQPAKIEEYDNHEIESYKSVKYSEEKTSDDDS